MVHRARPTAIGDATAVYGETREALFERERGGLKARDGPRRGFENPRAEPGAVAGDGLENPLGILAELICITCGVFHDRRRVCVRRVEQHAVARDAVPLGDLLGDRFRRHATDANQIQRDDE